MAAELHRCSNQWVKIKGHPCWKVEKALMDMGVEYERVPGPYSQGEARNGLRGHGPAPLPGHPVRVPRGIASRRRTWRRRSAPAT